jgi:hypothetical protein
LQRASNAAKEWSGPFAALRQKKEKLEAQVKSVLEAHARADQEGAAASRAACCAEQDRVQKQRQRLEKQAARIPAFLAEHKPKRGSCGKELQSPVTDNDSAKMQTAHGVIQGDNGQALVDEQYQGIGQAEAFGHGQDYGHVAPMLDGAKANVHAIGLPETYFEGQVLSAASNDHREAHLATCAQEKRDAYMPDTHCRQRAPRFATQARHKPQAAEQFTLPDFLSDSEQDCDRCPHGKVLKLAARRHKIGHQIYRRYEAEEADCQSCPLREQCLQNVATRRKYLAVCIAKATETLSQQMITQRDTPEARKMYGFRLAIVEPGFGNIRTQKR